MSYRRRDGRRAKRRQKVTRGEMARAMARSFNLYERNRLRKAWRRGALALLAGGFVLAATYFGWRIG